MNSTDSYDPRMKPSLGGQSECWQGLDITIKCLGSLLKEEVPEDFLDTASGSPKAEEEVMSKVTKSLGVVGPGNCADK